MRRQDAGNDRNPSIVQEEVQSKGVGTSVDLEISLLEHDAYMCIVCAVWLSGGDQSVEQNPVISLALDGQGGNPPKDVETEQEQGSSIGTGICQLYHVLFGCLKLYCSLRRG